MKTKHDMTGTNLKERLRYHITGAIERGGATPIIEQSKGEGAHTPLGGLNIDVAKSNRWPSYNWQDYQTAIVRQNHHISKVEARRDELLVALKEVALRCTQARIASEIGKQKNKVEFLLGELERIRNVAKAEGRSNE